MESDSPTYINGQRVTCQLDGMAIGCNRARELLDFGAAIPATLAAYQGRPGFRFESVWVGLFRYGPLPDIYGIRREGKISELVAVAHGSRFDGELVFSGGDRLFSWNITQTNPKIIGAKADPSVSKDKQATIDGAKDAIRKILTGTGPCATFFGANALAAFNSISFQTGTILEENDQNTKGVPVIRVGIYMVLGAVDAEAKQRGYVSVTQAIINNNGAFFKSTVSLLKGTKSVKEDTPNFGGYSPNTLQSRVIQLLHELGHIVLDNNGKELLPRDGNNPKLSEENTAKVKTACQAEIDALKSK